MHKKNFDLGLSKGVKAIQIGDCKVDKDCDKSCGAPGIGRCEFQKCYCIRGRFAEGKFSPNHHYKKWQSFVFDCIMLNINIY